MNWVKSNPFLSGLLAVVIVIAVGLAYLVYSSYANYAQISEEYDTQVSKLQSLQNKSPFPSADNNERFLALAANYEKEYQSLLAEVATMQLPVEPISPQAFQDRLRAVVSEIEAAAAANGVKLPEGFYMGFDQYQGTLPSDRSASVLARQLTAIKGLVDRLIEYRVSEIVTIRREPLPEEGAAVPPPEPPAAPSNTRNRPPTPSRNNEPEAPKVVQFFPFEVVFISEQGRLRQSLNALISSDQFFILRNLTVANSSLEGPSRALPETTADAAVATLLGDATGADAAAKPSLNVIVGREQLTVAARIEMVTFTPPEPQE